MVRRTAQWPVPPQARKNPLLCSKTKCQNMHFACFLGVLSESQIDIGRGARLVTFSGVQELYFKLFKMLMSKRHIDSPFALR